MRRRAERLARAIVVTEKMWRLQQAQLSRIDRELSALRAAEAAALEALPAAEPKLLLDRIGTLARRRLETEAARAEALARAHDFGQRMKLIEKLHSEAVETWRREERDEQGRHSQRPVSSPP